MKYKFTLLLILFSAVVTAQSAKVNIPDPAFRSYLLEYTGSGSPVSAGDGDTVIFSDISQVNELVMIDKGISDVTGIASFPGLVTLVVTNNMINEIDVSQNPLLTYLTVANNSLTSLDLSHNPLIDQLDASYNGLKSISLMNQKDMKALVIDNNELTELDLTENTKLMYLSCGFNLLKSIDLSNLPDLEYLYMAENNLGIINLTNQLNLIEFNADNNANCPLVLISSARTKAPEVFITDRNSVVSVFRDSKSNPVINSGTTGCYQLGDTGVYLNILLNDTNGEFSVTAEKGSKPTVIGSLPEGIDVISPDIWWRLTSSEFSGLSFSLIFDLSEVGGIDIFSNIQMLRRPHGESPWANTSFFDYIIYKQQPYITITEISMLGEFAVGSDKSNTLPVELADFSATVNQNSVLLQWETLTETNNAGWEIEGRQNLLNPHLSKGAGGFQKIGFVAGKGTTTESQTYSFAVNSSELKVQSYQFRLKQIDTDGNFSYSNILTVSLTPDNFDLSQNYPNPFNPTTAISYQLSADSKVKLVVFDLLGREVTTLVNEEKPAGSYTVTFSAANLPSGVYFYRLHAGNHSETKTMHLIK